MNTKSKTPKSPRTVKAGSVTVKIYYSHSYKYPTFTATWRIGLQRHRKTFSNEERAISFAQETAENLSTGHVAATTVTVAEAAILREAERLLAGSVPVHLAVSEYVTALQRLNGHGSLLEAVDHFVRFVARRETVRTVAEVVEDFIAAKTDDGLSGVYVNDLTWRLRRFAEAFPKTIGTITSAEIDRWLRDLSTSHRTRNNYRNLIISLFNFAKRRAHVARDRETEAQYTERPKVKQGPIDIFTPTELAEMLSVADGQPKLGLVLGAFTGIRSAELLRLHWENFNWEESVIDLGTDQTKTASRRLVPILPTLTEWIAPFVRQEGRVFSYSLPVCLAEAFGNIAKKVTKARGDSAPVFKWKTNALRHSFASYRVAMTLDVPSVALELGNSPQKVFSNYRKVVTRSQAEAWFAVRPANGCTDIQES